MYADLRHRPTVVSCTHRKIYSGEALGEFHDVPTLHGEPCIFWYWICESCLEVGSDPLKSSERPSIDGHAYWKMMKQRDPSCWIPSRYRN